MALDSTVIDSVSNSNFKTLGETSAQFSNMILTDAMTAQRNMTAIREKAVARSLERMDVTNDDEGTINTGGALAALVALAQQIMKGAGNTPPVTP